MSDLTGSKLVLWCKIESRANQAIWFRMENDCLEADKALARRPVTLLPYPYAAQLSRPPIFSRRLTLYHPMRAVSTL